VGNKSFKGKRTITIMGQGKWVREDRKKDGLYYGHVENGRGRFQVGLTCYMVADWSAREERQKNQNKEPVPINEWEGV